MLEDVEASLARMNNSRCDRLKSNSSRDCHVQVQVYLLAVVSVSASHGCHGAAGVL